MKYAEMYLAKYDGAIGTAIRRKLDGKDEVLWFTGEGSITSMSIQYFSAYYTIIRPYQPGEQLIITR